MDILTYEVVSLPLSVQWLMTSSSTYEFSYQNFLSFAVFLFWLFLCLQVVAGITGKKI